MCGRFIDPNLRGTETELSQIRVDPFPRRFNIKPTEEVLILGRRPDQAQRARWWLVPSWHRGTLAEWKATTFNARIEEAAGKPSFKGAWRYGRCLIPAGGYYEWTGTRGAKQPHAILPAGNAETLYFAGLYSLWQDLMTCTILTRAAGPDTAALHPRMPVILDPEERDAWLSGSEAPDLGAGARLRHHPVARFGLHDDGPQLLEPFDAA
ncbi:SOS response-associated peptidase [Frigidibacter sp. MR17.24]|uniref:SOS response-associated peptidase n=1 Tax=Frigidibacter sp. MR17.24 TaxID=3127345 RepID=UPI003012A3F8